MASPAALDFLEGKWRVWYKNLDVNKDGIVSYDDYTTALSDYEKNYKGKVNDAMMAKMRKGFAVYWEDVILGKFGNKDGVSEDDFVASMIKQYTANTKAFRDMVINMFENIIGAADADGNGLVSFSEFFTIFKAFGHRDENILRGMFDDYGTNENDEISLKAMTDSWCDILLGEDPQKVNIVINAFTRGAKPGSISM